MYEKLTLMNLDSIIAIQYVNIPFILEPSLRSAIGRSRTEDLPEILKRNQIFLHNFTLEKTLHINCK